MRTICLKMLAGAAALGMAGSAMASTVVSFSANLGKNDFLGPIAPAFDDRTIGLTGSITFAANISSGIFGLADLTGFSVDLHRALHPNGAPANVLLTADYHYSLSDLASFSMTFAGCSPTVGTW